MPEICLICTVCGTCLLGGGNKQRLFSALHQTVTVTGHVLQRRSQTLPLSLPAKGSIWRDKPVDQGLTREHSYVFSLYLA